MPESGDSIWQIRGSFASKKVETSFKKYRESLYPVAPFSGRKSIKNPDLGKEKTPYRDRLQYGATLVLICTWKTNFRELKPNFRESQHSNHF
ncbi:hypothetical protein LEP1GSC058_2777 [Leptospira fainei serovar Hurstbridge str. BUT 6]|uniref:Uncharacterized protein n=1 Tax=Leptospira fainei serovar Hurstbridge str. BUT 6 TaxID=1193011 RepID=S3UZE1_9LEPT|nr:hypothetical protein LEP1GSC058_2777 [Leptospira fainei serovar Hurstbridge str. BUT 6]